MDNFQDEPENMPHARIGVARFFLRILALFAFFYLTLFIPSSMIETARYYLGPNRVYVYGDYSSSIYANTPQYAAYGMNKLDDYPDQIFILGASTPGHVFAPWRIAEALPGYKVHNLCVQGSNITQITEVRDILESRVAISKLHSAVFVLNLHFVSFLDNERNSGGTLTQIDQEELRHHLYRLRDGRVTPLFTGPAMETALFLVRPFIWLYKLKTDTRNKIQTLRERIGSLSQPETQKNHSGNSNFYRSYRLMQFDGRLFTDDQFNILQTLVDRLLAEGATIVLVDLPVASYYRNDFPIYDEYRRRIKPIAANPALHYLDMTTAAPDNQFLDDAHAKPEFYEAWANMLIRHLKTIVKPPLKQEVVRP
jgi:hypothetical protein